MKKFTKLWLLTMTILLSSSVLFTQAQDLDAQFTPDQLEFLQSIGMSEDDIASDGGMEKANKVLQNQSAYTVTTPNPKTKTFSSDPIKNTDASVTVTVGTETTVSTSTNDTPFGTFYEDGQNQYLFTSTELALAGIGAGDITEIGWEVVSANATVMAGFNIEVKHTSATTVTDFETGFTNVYTGTHTAVVGWNMFTFSSAFAYDGASSLLVKVCFDNSAYGSNSSVYVSTTASAMNGWAYNDGTAGCSDPYEGSLTTRPNTRLTGEELLNPPPGLASNPMPLNGAVDVATSGNLTWDFGSDTDTYDLWFGPAGAMTEVVTAGTAGATGTYAYTAVSSSEYEWQVISYNAAKAQTNGPVWSFFTVCAPFPTDFVETFDNNVDPICWTNAGNGGPWVYGQLGSAGYNAALVDENTGNGGYYTWIDFSGTDDSVVLETPEIDVSLLTTPYLKFYFSSYPGTTIVTLNSLIVEAWDGAEWDTVTVLSENTGINWKYYGLDLSTFTYGTDMVQVRFRAVSGGDSYDYENDLLIDDVSLVEAPSCFVPTDLLTSNITLVGADLEWTEANVATNWDLYIVPAGDPAPVLGSTPTVENTTNNPYTWTGSVHSTAYDWYVRAECDPGNNNTDVSDWSSSGSFTTLCGVAAVPFIQTFDITATPACWTNTAAAGGPWFFGGTPGYGAAGATDHTGNGGYFTWIDFSTPDDSVVLESPEIDVSVLTTPYLQFYFFSNNITSAGLNFLYIEAWDGAAWVEVAMISENTGDWKRFGYDMSTFTYGANLVKFRFRGEATTVASQFHNDLLVDDVSLDEIPSCFEPYDLFTTGVFPDAATARWYRSQVEGRWEVVWGFPGTIVAGDPATYEGSGIHAPFVGTDPWAYDMTGLTPSTDYEWYVRAVCTPGVDTSLFAGPDFFTTLDVPGVLEGYVTEFIAKGPIANALVTIDTLYGMTDGTGFYQIDSIQPGTYTVFYEADGYISTDSTGVVLVSNDTTTVDIELYYGEINLDPVSFSETMDPFTQLADTFSITNTGNGDLSYRTSLDFLTDQVLTIYDGPTWTSSDVEANDAGPYEPYSTADAMWDTQFAYEGTPAGLTGFAGAETDGNYLYAAVWSSNMIAKFNLDGTWVENFSITGVTGLRDLAYDGQYFYGGAASTTIYEMDFNTQTLISTITAPTAVRAISYDEDADGGWGGFWYNNWSEDLTNIDRTGAVIQSIPTPPSMYGCAYDNISAGGPYLWIFTGTTSDLGCQVEQYDLNTLTLTGLTHSVSGDFGDAYIAGGLFVHANLETQTYTLGGLAQGGPEILFGYELGYYESWVTVQENGFGSVPAGGTVDVVFEYNTDKYWDVTKTGNISILHDGQTAKALGSIPLTLVVGPALTVPGVPSDPLPTDGELLVSNLPTLSWTNNYVVTDCDLNWREVGGTYTTITGLTDSYTFLTALDDATQYEWYVTCYNALGNTDGPVWTFTTIGFGNVGGLVYYENGAAEAQIPMEGVVVECVGITDTTDITGAYSLVGLPEGTHTITATFGGGYNPYVGEVTVTPFGVITFDIEMLYGIPPAGLVATAWNGSVDLNWNEPLNLYQIAYDDGTAEAFYSYNTPTSVNHMFYVHLNAPEDGTIEQISIWNCADASSDWESIQVCPDDGLGAPDLTDPHKVFTTDLNINVPFPGEWKILDLGVDAFTVTPGEDFYIVIQWPDGNLDGPFINTDTDGTVANRSAYSGDAGVSWTQFGGGNWIMRAFYSTTAKAGNVTLKTIPQENAENFSVPARSIIKSEKANDPITGQIGQSFVAPQLVAEGQSSTKALVGYKVYRGTDPLALTYLADAADTLYTDITVTNGTVYYYAVAGVQDEGQSPFSNIAMALPIVPVSLPYSSDLEGDDGGFVGTVDWEWGAPTYASGPAGAASGTNVWGTALDTNYINNSNSWLINTFDLSAKGDYQIEFMRWLNIESGWDYGYVGVDHDNDGNYDILKTYSEIDENWVQDYVFLPDSLTSDFCKIAFILITDGSVTRPGFYIDDLAVNTYDPPVSEITPDLLEETVVQNGNAYGSLAVDNSGGFPLEYTATVKYPVGTVVLTEGFETPWPPASWTVVQGECSPTNDIIQTGDQFYNGDSAVRFTSYSSCATYDQYMITPELTVAGADHAFSFWYLGEYSWASETFRIGWSSTGTNLATDFTWGPEVSDATDSWKQFSNDIPVGTKYVAIHYYSDYQYYLYIDDVKVELPAGETGWLSIEGGTATSGSVLPSEGPMDLEVMYDAGGIAIGDWTGWIEFVTNEAGAEATVSIPVTLHVIDGVVVDLQVFLSGAFDTTTFVMNTGMNDLGVLPLNQPYQVDSTHYQNPDPPLWYYAGTEFVTAIPDTTVVDWIIVELRDAADSASATGATKIDSTACFLLEDGSVVGLDGRSLLAFAGTTVTQNLYAVIKHRNHLAVMSSYGLTTTGGIYTYDFTDSISVYGGASGHLLMDVTSDIWGMISSDGDANGLTQLSDKNVPWKWSVGESGYLGGDFDLNGFGQLSDKNVQWEQSLGGGQQVPAKGLDYFYKSQVPK